MKVLIDGVEYVPKALSSTSTKSLGQLFTCARQHNGLTFKRLAKATGLSMGKLTHAEFGTCSLETAMILADYYGIPAEQISHAVLRNRK